MKQYKFKIKAYKNTFNQFQLADRNFKDKSLYKKGLYYYKKKDLTNALECIKGAIELDPQNAKYHFEACLIETLNKNFSEAYKHIDRAILLEPKEPVLINQKACTLFDEEKYVEAMELFDFLIANSLDYKTEATYNKGNCHEMLEQYREATFCYEQVMQRKPSNDKIFTIALYFSKMDSLGYGTFDKAINYFDRLGQNVLALNGKACLLFRKANQSIQHLQSQNNMSNDFLIDNTGLILQNKKMYEQAILHFEQARCLLPDFNEFNSDYENCKKDFLEYEVRIYFLLLYFILNEENTIVERPY